MTIVHHTGNPAIGTDLDTVKAPGHWLLARAGKRVLRPGGLELTDFVLDHLDVTESDDVVEFAPGLGATTELILSRGPSTYVGVERDGAAVDTVRTLLRAGDRCIEATAQANGLADASADVVTGEAFLTMQGQAQKERIVAEAFRLLRPGGRYGFHEMCLRPDSLDATTQADIRDELSHSIHVGARPLTVADWRAVLEGAGFTIEYQHTVDMALLQPRRLIADEGLTNAARIAFNVVRDTELRHRIAQMRGVFRGRREQLGAVAFVATKKSSG